MKNHINMADICELAHELTIRELGDRSETVSRGKVVTVKYTKVGQKVFDSYYDLITNTLKV
jgi:hypothetical protein